MPKRSIASIASKHGLSPPPPGPTLSNAFDSPNSVSSRSTSRSTSHKNKKRHRLDEFYFNPELFDDQKKGGRRSRKNMRKTRRSKK